MLRGARATEIAGAQPALAGTTGETWRARPALATAIGTIVLAGPLALSVAAAYGASRLVLPPTGSRVQTIAWWVGVSGIATAALVVAGRLARRLLPLAALMRLSLVFPDVAPSRFRIALRTGTVDTLEERLADARRGAAERTPVQSARLLLELVAHLDEHDPLTRGHSERVRAYAQSIGRELGLDARELDLLNWAALLHDIGKLDVPHEILAKSGPPTDTEWEALRRHPESGARLAAPLREWLGEWSAAIEQHHERWDGTGYPHGLAGDEISLAGRIVAVADVFDVITSTRSYKRQASVSKARKELARCAGTQLDPEVVRAFLGISVRQGRLAAPLAWLAQAAVLVRLPVTQATGALSAGAVATVAVGAGLGVQTHPPRLAEPPAPVVYRSARPAPQHVALEPASGSRPAVASATPTRGTESKPEPEPRPRPKPSTRAAPPATPAPPPKAEPAAPAPTVDPPAPAPKASPHVAPPSPAPTSAPPSPPKPPTSSRPPALAPVVPPVAPPAVPELLSAPPLPAGGGSPPTEALTGDLADDVSTVTHDVTSVVDDVGSVADPATPLSDDLSDTVDDVSKTLGDVGSLLTPPEDEPDDDDGGLLGGLLG